MAEKWTTEIYSGTVTIQFPAREEGTEHFENEAERRKAVVRLIAAAPQLLDALVGLYEHTKNDYGVAGLNTAALEAIEAAAGRSPYDGHEM